MGRGVSRVWPIFCVPQLSQELAKLYKLQTWPEHSQGPSEQEHIKNVGKKSVSLSRDCPFLGTPYYLRNR